MQQAQQENSKHAKRGQVVGRNRTEKEGTTSATASENKSEKKKKPWGVNVCVNVLVYVSNHNAPTVECGCCFGLFETRKWQQKKKRETWKQFKQSTGQPNKE